MWILLTALLLQLVVGQNTPSSADLLDIFGAENTISPDAMKKKIDDVFGTGTGQSIQLSSDALRNRIDEVFGITSAKEGPVGADGSDNWNNTITDITTTPRISVAIPISSDGKCQFPPHPEHGRYVAINAPNASPGQKYDNLHINASCNRGYGIVGESSLFCYSGWWSQSMPTCERFCKLNKHPSVDYFCLVSGKVIGQRACEDYEPPETIALPVCKKPNYYSPFFLNNMKCIEGSWNYVATCEPECGRITPKGTQFVINGINAKRGELPWHAGVYSKQYKPYMQICGGTLVSNTLVVSAAHCFWSNDNRPMPANLFAVALGKLYRPWNDMRDIDAQKSNVNEIKLPTRFNGNRANFQEDIALVILEKFIEYQTYIRPICMDFDYYFEQRQLKHGSLGKVAGWGFTSEDGSSAQILQVADLPYVDVLECRERIPADFVEYITSDKICAGYGNGTALCRGDSGGGLVFPAVERNGVIRYYLRGIVSTAPKDQQACNSFSLTTFTSLQKHEFFFRRNAYL